MTEDELIELIELLRISVQTLVHERSAAQAKVEHMRKNETRLLDDLTQAHMADTAYVLDAAKKRIGELSHQVVVAQRGEDDAVGKCGILRADVCWHCAVELSPVDNLRPRCQECPAECDIAGCTEPGCSDELTDGFDSANRRYCGECQPTGFDMPDPPRAHRIEVDRCRDCPFILYVPINGGEVRCAHPTAPRRMISGLIKINHVEPRDPPPDWCPLRGSITMITGPPIEEALP